MSRLLRLILLDSCCFLPKNWKLVETRSSQLSFNLALGHVCWIPVNCWANTHEPRPYIPWLSRPADLHSLFWPLPSFTQSDLLRYWLQHILRQVRVKMFRLKRNTEVPAATCCPPRDLVTSCPMSPEACVWLMSSDLRTLVDCTFQSDSGVL